MPNYLDNIDVIDANKKTTNVLLHDRGTAATASQLSSDLLALTTKVDNLSIKNVLDYGAVGDGVTDDTAAIQAIIESDMVLYFPSDHEFKLTELLIDKSNVTITGGGWIEGTIKVRAPWPNNTPINLIITGLTFNGGNPIVIDRGIGIKIFENRFYNTEKCITLSPTGDYSSSGSWSHLVEDLNLSNNYVYMCDYFIYGDKGTITNVPQDYLYVGDMSVINNQVKVAKITHVYVACCDGCIISENTFYHYGYASQVPTKMRCIHFYDYIVGAIITNNALFEAGREGIYLFNANRCTIRGNQIIQCGQVYPSSAILVTSYVNAGYYLVISDNLIYAPSKYGIELENATNAEIVDNYIYNPASDGAYYGEEFNNPPMSSITHFGVSLTLASGISYEKIIARNVITTPNTMYNGFTPSGYGEKYITNSTPTADSCNDGATIVYLNPSSATNITGLNGTNLNTGDIVTLVMFNSNVTLKHGTDFRLKGGVDYNAPANTIVQFKYVNGQFWEIGRTET